MSSVPSAEFLSGMPKVELHVHIEGSIRPETVIKLAERNHQHLPANTVDGLRSWYDFRDFEHFVEVYVSVTKCIKTPEDIELLVREFLQGQRAQNILHTEATYTASTLEKHCGIPWDEQIDAINRARHWGERELGTSLGIIVDIVRGDPVDKAMTILRWVKDAQGNGVVALGLAGIERLGTRQYEPVFRAASQEGVTAICHAGETSGAESVWEVLEVAGSRRIGHGVRCLSDQKLVDHLREHRIPLEVCPSSNVCIGVFPSMADHPIRAMKEAGLVVTVNSDDPPMFGTSLNEEWSRIVETFEFDFEDVKEMSLNAVDASLVDEAEKRALRQKVETAFESVETSTAG